MEILLKGTVSAQFWAIHGKLCGNCAFQQSRSERNLNLKPIENIFHIVKQQLHQDAWDQQIIREDFPFIFTRYQTSLEITSIHVADRTPFNVSKNQGIYYIIKKDRTLIPSFVIIIKCIELFCYKKCLVTCNNNYTPLFQECIMQEKWTFQGIKFSTFYKSSSIEVVLKTVYEKLKTFIQCTKQIFNNHILTTSTGLCFKT